MTRLDRILRLPDEYAKSFHPAAVASYRQFIDDIRGGVPLDRINDRDVKRVLNELEYYNYELSVKSLHRWLDKCLLNKEFTADSYCDPFPSLGTWGFKSLLVKVYREKQRVLENEQTRRQLQRMVAEARRQQEQRLAQAKLDGIIYEKRIAAAMEKLKSDLANVKKPDFNYPPALAPYLPHEWCHLEPPEGVENWAVPQILERIPQELSGRVALSLSYEWVDLPYCEYAVVGEQACLNWLYKRMVLITVALKLKNGSGTLGAIYFGPVYWENKGGFIAPVVLLALLARGDLAAPGIEVANRLAPSTTFKVAGYPEEVFIHDLFRSYLRDVVGKKPLGQALLKQGLIDADIAKLVKGKLNSAIPGNGPAGKPAEAADTKDKDGILATLLGMGYKKDEVEKALQSIDLPSGLSTEDKVKSILVKIGG